MHQKRQHHKKEKLNIYPTSNTSNLDSKIIKSEKLEYAQLHVTTYFLERSVFS